MTDEREQPMPSEPHAHSHEPHAHSHEGQAHSHEGHAHESTAVSPQRKPQKLGLPGLVKGMAVTARNLVTPSHTAEYPDVAPDLPPRSRGVIALLAENCTVCMLCARECPDWCIYIDSHKETLPATTEGGRERQRNVLERFDIDFSLCMYCGICIEVCPFDALEWSPEFEYAELDIRDLIHDKERLGQWMPTVPPPPAADPGAPPPKEVASSQRPARPARVAKPVVAKPAATEPVSTEPVATEPAATEPAAPEPPPELS